MEKRKNTIFYRLNTYYSKTNRITFQLNTDWKTVSMIFDWMKVGVQSEGITSLEKAMLIYKISYILYIKYITYIINIYHNPFSNNTKLKK